ncbi:solute carrier organic anion transporter family member 5A1-like [Ptychodera flava]|uniref:solute carrier organic anion transporter family member 5A1-like n=1 Tax=Ptychodera flava TaxID=63121 RepID=UPI00396A4CAE
METDNQNSVYYVPAGTQDSEKTLPEDRSTWCGYGKWRPRCLQRFANGKGFVFFACLMTLFQSMVASGYTSSVVTTIERRFQLKSSQSGFVVSSYELGALLVIAFVSYFGGKGHRPKWIAYGALLMSVGTVLFVLPHFVGSRYDIQDAVNTTEPEICETSPAKKIRHMSCENKTSYTIYILFFIGAQLLLGMGTSPIFTLGTTYVDDNIPRKRSATYMGILYCMASIGPALGFVVGAFALRVYVDIGFIDLEDVPIEPKDPRWVGAWWGGYVTIGIIIAILAVPLLGYPKVLESAALKEVEDANNDGSKDEGHTTMKITNGKLRDFPKAVGSLCTNPIYICISLAGAMELAIVTGFVTFIPKYLESQYAVTPSTASLLTGLLIPGAACGTVFGGFLVNKFSLKTVGTARLGFVCVLISFLCYGSLFPLRCGSQNLAGVSVDYLPRDIRDADDRVNITSNCNYHCQCDPSTYQPVCGENGVTYFSPCYAGCEKTVVDVDEDEGVRMNFTNCACISDYLHGSVDDGETRMTYATYGKCERDCSAELGVFMAVLIGVVFMTALTQIPLLMTTLRSVGEDEKPFALGMQFVLFKAIAYVPAPMYYGQSIDDACMLWEKHCENVGACLEYDLERFRFVYIGLSTGLKFLSLCFVTLAFLAARRRYAQYELKAADENRTADHPGPQVETELTMSNLTQGDNPSTISGNLAGRDCSTKQNGLSFETSL